MNNQKGNIVLMTLMVVLFIVIIGIAGYFLFSKYVIPRIEPPLLNQNNSDPTADWEKYSNDEYGFEFKYPHNFFNLNQRPKVLIGDCNYNIFPDTCPSISDVVAKDQTAGSNYLNINKDTILKLTINNTPYCLYQAHDAAMGHYYNYYYYATVKNPLAQAGQKCLVVYLAASAINCDFYLPLEKGNTEQQKNYNDCLVTNENQPKVLDKIISTFKFIK